MVWLLLILFLLLLTPNTFAKTFFFEVENHNIEIRDGHARDPETKEWIPVDIEITWVLWNFGQSGKALHAFEGSGVMNSAYDRGKAVVSINKVIPAGTYNVWYRVTETGQEWVQGNLRYAWLEWPIGSTAKEDLVPFISIRPRRVFGDWVRVAEGVELPDLRRNELSCILEVLDEFPKSQYTSGKYKSVGWDAICISDDPDYIPPSTVPEEGWEIVKEEWIILNI